MTDRDWRPLTVIDGATAAKIRELTAEVERLRAALAHCAAQAGPESCADVLSTASTAIMSAIADRESAEAERDEALAATARFADGIEAIRLERNDRDDDIALLLRDNAKLKDSLATARAEASRLRADWEEAQSDLSAAHDRGDREHLRAARAEAERDEAVGARDSALRGQHTALDSRDAVAAAVQRDTAERIAAWLDECADTACVDDPASASRQSTLYRVATSVRDGAWRK